MNALGNYDVAVRIDEAILRKYALFELFAYCIFVHLLQLELYHLSNHSTSRVINESMMS